jgi:hypothetical protein
MPLGLQMAARCPSITSCAEFLLGKLGPAALVLFMFF